MGVKIRDLYLFDSKKRLRAAVIWGYSRLIHDETEYMLEAEILTRYGAKTGEFLGFACVDGRSRLFEIERIEHDDARGVDMITGTEAAVAELAHTIAGEIRLEGATAQEAAQAALSGSGFAIGTVEGSKTKDVALYYPTRWKALREIETLFGLRAVAYYTIEDGQITGKSVDLLEKTYPNRGRLFERERDASGITVIYDGAPVTRMYGFGEATGDEDPPTCLTFADVEWSVSNGDPLDKPLGQIYIEDPQAIAEHGSGREAKHEDKNITNAQELLEKTYEQLMMRRSAQVSGGATLRDLEMEPGQSHKMVRPYDTVTVRTQKGGDVTGVIVGIRRSYHPGEETRITLGSEDEESTEDIVKKVARIAGETKRLGGSAGGGANKQKLMDEHIRLIAGNLDAYQEGTDERLTTAELTLYGDGESAGAGLVARVENAEGEISSAALTLYGDGTSANAGLVARVGENEAAITAAVDELGSELELKADKITLNGYVTAKQLETEFTNFESGISDDLYVSALSANSFECSSFDFKGNGISLAHKSVLNGNTTVQTTASGGVVTGVTLSRKYTDLYFLSWE